VATFGSRLLLTGSLLLLTLAPAGALAADIKAQSSTQYLWYNDPFQDRNQGDLLQYVKFSATKIDAANRFSTVGYGRVSQQFDSSNEAARGDSDDVLGRIYFLYLNYAFSEDRGDIRLGRQFVAVGAGSGTIDGARVDVRNYGPVAISVFGGYNVVFAETTDRTETGNYLTGASAGGSFFKGNNVEVSYLRKYDESDVVRETAGLHVDQTVLEKIKGYADLRYDIVHEAYGEFLAGIHAVPFSERMLTLTAEYYSSYPTFDADTVYTVFAVTRYQEALGRVDWIVNPEWTLYGSYTRADYDGPTANVGTFGVRNRSKSVKGLTVNASLDIRRGYPGDLTGCRASADYAFGKKALLAAGAAYDSFQRDSMQDGFNAKKFWAGGSYAVRKDMVVKVRVEDAVDRLSSNEIQGRASVDFSF